MMEDDPTTEPATIAAPVATTPVVRLVYSGDQILFRDYPLDDKETECGRAVQGVRDLKLDTDARLSRFHATFLVDHDRVRLLNNSQNGSFVNGERVDGEVPLADGDVVRLGDTFAVLRFIPDGLQEHPLEGIVGRAPSMSQLRTLLDVVGPTKSSVVLLGETGSGKDLAATALHKRSGRKGPFVAVNCAAIPEGLAESQLFGHKAGSFTGAHRDHVGFFSQADGGTLFLDEVGELPQVLQPKLLRVLDEGKVWPVGATAGVAVDVRVVSATNREIAREVEQHTFRADLFARLAEITISLPPLRQRKEDVLLLLRTALPKASVSAALAESLLLHHWPFNVRELLKIAAELEVKAQGRALLDVDLLEGRAIGPQPPSERAERSSKMTAAPSVMPTRPGDKVELPVPSKEELQKLLLEHKGKVSEISRVTGRSRTQVYRWLEQYGFDVKDFRG